MAQVRRRRRVHGSVCVCSVCIYHISRLGVAGCGRVLQGVAGCVSVLQCVAACGSVSQLTIGVRTLNPKPKPRTLSLKRLEIGARLNLFFWFKDSGKALSPKRLKIRVRIQKTVQKSFTCPKKKPKYIRITSVPRSIHSR